MTSTVPSSRAMEPPVPGSFVTARSEPRIGASAVPVPMLSGFAAVAFRPRLGTIDFEGRMIDEPILRQARELVR